MMNSFSKIMYTIMMGCPAKGSGVIENEDDNFAVSYGQNRIRGTGAP